MALYLYPFFVVEKAISNLELSHCQVGLKYSQGTATLAIICMLAPGRFEADPSMGLIVLPNPSQSHWNTQTQW